jgi:hypothetical protein
MNFMYDVKLSRRLKLIKSSWADSRVNSLKSNVSGTVSVPIIRALILLWPECSTYIPPKSPCLDSCERMGG